MPVEVVEIDEDGNLICAPRERQHDQDKGLSQIVIPIAEARKTKPTPGIGNRLLIRLRKVDDEDYEGSIIRQIGRPEERILAVFQERKGAFLADPVERGKKDSYLIHKDDRGKAKAGDIVWLEPKRTKRHEMRKGRITGIAGNMEEPGAYSLIALASHDIRIDFPDKVIKEAEAIKLPTMQGRTDLRTAGLITIDPADAKDHDDAVSAAEDDDPSNEGGYRVWVAIADVSWFVRPGSALDEEALKRANSVYLPDRVIPMLPEALSNNLCSLRDREDRPCLAVEMTLNKNGQMISHRFERAMMQSAAKLSYEDAQAIIEKSAAPSNDTEKNVKTLFAAYQCRLNERQKRAPLDLELSETKIILGDDGLVDSVAVRERFDAHKLIEEFMILANVAAAQTLEQAKVPLIYRVHDTPDPEKLKGIRTYLNTLDYSMVKGNSIRPSHFNQILKLAEKRDQKEMISEVILRTQNQAVYATENLGHFGLNLTRYAHFTSPIRRYADLTVHRALIKACNLGSGGQTKSESDTLSEIAKDISTLERRAMLAERETNDRYLSEFLSSEIGTVFSARIRGVTRFGLFVMLNGIGADGFIPMRSIPGRGWFHNEELNRIEYGSSGQYYHLGQSVKVRLLEAAPVEGGLVFELLSKPLRSGKTSSGKHKKSSSHNSADSYARRKPSKSKNKKKKKKKAAK